MTLHPHVPHELKDFGKHLFATFLGLLMALGLEQWREHRVEMKQAHHAMLQIENELQGNLRALREQCARMKAAQEKNRKVMAAMADYLASRRAGQKIKPQEFGSAEFLELSFTCSAWDAAKASGGLRNVPPERLSRIANLYAMLERSQNIQDGLLITPTSMDAFLFSQEAPDSLTLPQLERLVESIRLGCRWQARRILIGEGFCEHLEAMLKL